MSQARRFPSLGEIARLSSELDWFRSGRPMRYNPDTHRIEAISSWKHLLLSIEETLALSGSSVTSTVAFPVGAYRFLVETEVLTAVVTSPGGGGYTVGFAGDHTCWGQNNAPTAGTITGAAGITLVNPILAGTDPAPTPIVIAATAGTFSSGGVKVTGWYMPW